MSSGTSTDLGFPSKERGGCRDRHRFSVLVRLDRNGKWIGRNALENKPLT